MAAQEFSSVRIDKWLWAARFFKSRSLAAEAASGGKVHLGGHRAKPAREVRIGERITIRRGPYEWEITVKGLATRRGPSKEAVLLYEETEESIRNRESVRAQLQAEGPPPLRSHGRPTKKDRRELNRLARER